MPPKKVKNTTNDGPAASWWKRFKSTRTCTCKEPIQSWENLKKHLRKKHLLRNYDQAIYNRLQNLKQGIRMLEEYLEEFSNLLTRHELYDNEIQLVSRFIGGSRPQLQNAMAQFDPPTIAATHHRAFSFK